MARRAQRGRLGDGQRGDHVRRLLAQRGHLGLHRAQARVERLLVHLPLLVVANVLAGERLGEPIRPRLAVVPAEVDGRMVVVEAAARIRMLDSEPSSGVTEMVYPGSSASMSGFTRRVNSRWCRNFSNARRTPSTTLIRWSSSGCPLPPRPSCSY